MLESEKDVLCALLNYVYKLGLISKHTCSAAEDSVHSMTDFPEFFQHPVGMIAEDQVDECT